MTSEQNPRSIAYFTMEIGLSDAIPTYCGGLGVLAGDTVRSFADLGVPVAVVTMLYRQGYFRQELEQDGNQREYAIDWDPNAELQKTEARTTIEIAGRTVHVTAYRYDVKGVHGHIVPVYFLDTDLEENEEHDRHISGRLYQGDRRYRLEQEMVLGVAGEKLLVELGHSHVKTIHMNEGHAALAALADFSRHRESGKDHSQAVAATRSRFVFTTHTPVPAGHDVFDRELAQELLNAKLRDAMDALDLPEGRLDMSRVALALSRYANGVALRHGEVSREMFPRYTIDAITNGVHVPSWTSAPFAALWDKHIPRWREDSLELRNAVRASDEEIWEAHQKAKQILFELVKKRCGQELDANAFTMGFARRVVGYKRASLIMREPERLKAIAEKHGTIQLVYAGKAHPNDAHGRDYLKTIFSLRDQVAPHVKVIYIPNYDLQTGLAITTGCDVWLNNPIPPREASGTSGMKSAINGVPSLSILDGWWCEGHVQGVTGWAIGEAGDYKTPRDDARDAASIYEQLDEEILPMFHKDRAAWLRIMRNAIALNGPYFNTQRMVQEYTQRAYLTGQ